MSVEIFDISASRPPFSELRTNITGNPNKWSEVHIVCIHNIIHTFCSEENAYKYMHEPYTENCKIFLNEDSISFTVSRGTIVIPYSSIIYMRVKE